MFSKMRNLYKHARINYITKFQDSNPPKLESAKKNWPFFSVPNHRIYSQAFLGASGISRKKTLPLPNWLSTQTFPP
jgi:hypothetical protein